MTYRQLKKTGESLLKNGIKSCQTPDVMECGPWLMEEINYPGKDVEYFTVIWSK